MVLEIINKMSKNQKSSLIVWNTVAVHAITLTRYMQCRYVHSCSGTATSGKLDNYTIVHCGVSVSCMEHWCYI